MQWSPYKYSSEEVKRNDPNKKRRWLIPLVLAAQIAFKVGHLSSAVELLTACCQWNPCCLLDAACSLTSCSFLLWASAIDCDHHLAMQWEIPSQGYPICVVEQ